MVVLVLITTVVLILTFFIYKVAFGNLNHWKDRKICGPNPAPIFGNYSDFLLLRKNLGFVTQDIYNQFLDQKYVGAFLGTKPVLIIRDPELIKLIMVKDFYYFNSRGLDFDIKQEPMTANLFATSGDFWRILRHNLTPLFSSAKMRNMFHLVAQCEREFMKFTHQRVAECTELEVRDLMSRFSMDVIGSCAFGLMMNSTSDEDSTFRNMGYKIFEPSRTKSIKLFLRLLAPWLYKILNLHIDKDVDDFFLELSKKTMEIREGKPAVRHDFIDLLAELKKRGHIEGDSIHNMKPEATKKSVSVALDEALLAAQSFVFFAAGFETSSTTMGYALYVLANNPKTQERVHAEIDALLKKNNGDISYEMLQEAHYLNMVIDETLRIYPVLTVITRQCTSLYTLPDGKVVDEGVIIHIPAYAIHHDPQHYPDPELFDPERFAPEMKQQRNQYTYIPFGEGHRICIGLRFGKMQVLMGLISVLRNYTVSPTARTPERLQFEPKAIITTPTSGIWLKLTPRNSNSF